MRGLHGISFPFLLQQLQVRPFAQPAASAYINDCLEPFSGCLSRFAKMSAFAEMAAQLFVNLQPCASCQRSIAAVPTCRHSRWQQNYLHAAHEEVILSPHCTDSRSTGTISHHIPQHALFAHSRPLRSINALHQSTHMYEQCHTACNWVRSSFVCLCNFI